MGTYNSSDTVQVYSVANYTSWESNEPMFGVRIQLNSDP